MSPKFGADPAQSEADPRRIVQGARQPFKWGVIRYLGAGGLACAGLLLADLYSITKIYLDKAI